MSKENKTLEVEGRFRGVIIRVVQHETIRSMIDEIKANYLDGSGRFTNISDDIEMIHAITLGQYIKSQPEITVFIPFEISDYDLKNVIPHEALHATMAIVRNEIANTIDPKVPLHIDTEKGGDYEIEEEEICIICGELSRAIESAIASITKTRRECKI